MNLELIEEALGTDFLLNNSIITSDRQENILKLLNLAYKEVTGYYFDDDFS